MVLKSTATAHFLAIATAFVFPSIATGTAPSPASACEDGVGSRYFGYGSNLDAPFMMERLKEGKWVDDWHKDGVSSNRKPVDLGCYILDDYVFAYNLDGEPLGEPYASATVRPKRGEKVYGVLWDIAPKDLVKLDIGEEVPRAYFRACLTVTPCHGEIGPPRSAWVYIGQEHALTNQQMPDPEYVRLLKQGAKAHGVPATYIHGVLNHDLGKTSKKE